MKREYSSRKLKKKKKTYNQHVAGIIKTRKILIIIPYTFNSY